MANKGFIRSVITDMMRKRGIDESYYDEAYVDETLTTRENIANLRDKVYHLDEDLTESQHSQMKEYTQQEEWAKAQKQPEEDDRLDTIGFGRTSMFKSKASEGGRGRYGSKASKKHDRGFWNKMVETEKGYMKQPPNPKGIARYFPKPIDVKKDRAMGSLLGVPEGTELRPARTFTNPPSSIFGSRKPEQKKKRNPLDWL